MLLINDQHAFGEVLKWLPIYEGKQERKRKPGGAGEAFSVEITEG